MNNFDAAQSHSKLLTPEPAGISKLAISGLTSQEVDIFQRIHRAIVEQRLLPAARLTEEELTGIFNVSRMRIRRVLLALAHTGMISLPRGRGAQVASPTVDEARAVFAARRLIETAILEQATTPSKQALSQVKRIIAAEDVAFHAQDRVAMIHLSGAFHIELARICANPVVMEIVAGLVMRSSLVIALFQRSTNICCRSNEHQDLLKALAKGDLPNAVQLMRSHLNTIESGLNLTVQSSGPQNLHEILSPPKV